MSRKILALVALLAAGPAWAGSGDLLLGPDGGGKVANPPCAQPVPGAAYTPGTAADGSAIAAPADLASQPSPVTPDGVSTEIDQHLKGQFGVPPTAGTTSTYSAKAVIGQVTVKDGAASLNGKPLAPEANAAITTTCSRATIDGK